MSPEDFQKKVRNLSPRDNDRKWVDEEGWSAWREARDRRDASTLQMERLWVEALYRVARSDASEGPLPDPEDYHFHLVEALGSRGATLLRLHRQSHLIAVPWMRDTFLETTRISALSYLLQKEKLSLQEIDRMWNQRHREAVARQLISVFACDFRIEQQKDFSGQVSLRRSLEHGHPDAVLFERLEEAFLGREDLLADIESRSHGADWTEYSAWLHESANQFCFEYDLASEADLGYALWKSACKTWQRKNKLFDGNTMPAKKQ